MSRRRPHGGRQHSEHADRRVVAPDRRPRHAHLAESGCHGRKLLAATTLFDYIRRAMPFTAPGSLSADEIYAVCAYILAEAKIIDKATVLDAQTLPRVEMPNRNGFIPDPRPELFK